MRHWCAVRALELRVPPVAVVLVVALCMWLVARVVPAVAADIPWRVAAAIACAALGAAIVLAGMAAFRLAHTLSHFFGYRVSKPPR